MLRATILFGVVAGLASADTISMGFGGTGTGSGTGTVGSTPTIQISWVSALNPTVPAFVLPTGGLVDLQGLKLNSATINNANGQAVFTYSTATNQIVFSSTNPYSAIADFTDPNTITLGFNATAGTCAVNSSCAGSFTIGGNVLYSTIDSSLASALGIAAVPPAPGALGTLTITFKGTLVSGATAGSVASFLSGGTSPVFSGGSTFDNTNNPPPAIPEPSSMALAGLGTLAVGLGILRRKKA